MYTNVLRSFSIKYKSFFKTLLHARCKSYNQELGLQKLFIQVNETWLWKGSISNKEVQLSSSLELLWGDYMLTVHELNTGNGDDYMWIAQAFHPSSGCPQSWLQSRCTHRYSMFLISYGLRLPVLSFPVMMSHHSYCLLKCFTVHTMEVLAHTP